MHSQAINAISVNFTFPHVPYQDLHENPLQWMQHSCSYLPAVSLGGPIVWGCSGVGLLVCFSPAVVSMATGYRDIVAGLVCVKRVTDEPGLVLMTPGQVTVMWQCGPLLSSQVLCLYLCVYRCTAVSWGRQSGADLQHTPGGVGGQRKWCHHRGQRDLPGVCVWLSPWALSVCAVTLTRALAVSSVFDTLFLASWVGFNASLCTCIVKWMWIFWLLVCATWCIHCHDV